MRSFKKQIVPDSLRHIFLTLLCITVMLGLLGCGDAAIQPETLETDLPTPQIKLTDADLNTDAKNAVKIDLNKLEHLCLIEQPGTYLLSGELTGYIQINAQDQIIHLILDHVTVNAPAGPALEVISAGKVILTMKDSTINTLQDSGDYVGTPDADACIYSTCDLTINGNGTLNVSGYFKDAIHTKDVLKVLNKSCFIQSKRDGLHGNDGIVVCSESLTVQSERNGLHSTKTGKPAKGNVEIYNSSCSIIGGKYAISCIADLYIADSSIYAMGVYDDLQVFGKSFVSEGSLQNA